MLLVILRSILCALFLVLTIAAAFAAFLPSKNAGTSELATFLTMLIFTLVAGPLWPSSRNMEKWSNFFDRLPRVSGFLGYAILALAGTCIAWGGLNYADQRRPGRGLRIIYDMFGYQGVGYVYLLAGACIFVTGVVGCILVFRKQETLPHKSQIPAMTRRTARYEIESRPSTKIVDEFETDTRDQTIEDVLLHGEKPTDEFLEDFIARSEAPPISDEELERQALENPGDDGNKRTPG